MGWGVGVTPTHGGVYTPNTGVYTPLWESPLWESELPIQSGGSNFATPI